MWLFKEKRYRPLGYLLASLAVYMLVATISLTFIFTTGHDPIRPYMNGLGFILNLFTMAFCLVTWRKDHKHWTEKEKEQVEKPPFLFDVKEIDELEKVGINPKFLQPIDYKKYKRQEAWMWSVAILANLVSIGTHFW
jgi:hypothetical protein